MYDYLLPVISERFTNMRLISVLSPLYLHVLKGKTKLKVSLPLFPFAYLLTAYVDCENCLFVYVDVHKLFNFRFTEYYVLY